MSTRGCVALKTEKGWEGVYNHYDSYPEGLGAELYSYLKDRINDPEAMQKFKKELLHAGDWRNYLNGCKCEYCGKSPIGQPHSISGVLFMRKEVSDEEKYKTKEELKNYYKKDKGLDNEKEIESLVEREFEIRENIKNTGYIDPNCKYHDHSDLEKAMTPENSDALFIEWVYVIDIDNKKIDVLASYSLKGFKSYAWSKVGELDLISQNEPDFEKLREKRDNL